MAEQSESLKAEMSELLRADRERARERKPVTVPTATPSPEPPSPEPRPGLLRRLFR